MLKDRPVEMMKSALHGLGVIPRHPKYPPRVRIHRPIGRYVHRVQLDHEAYNMYSDDEEDNHPPSNGPKNLVPHYWDDPDCPENTWNNTHGDEEIYEAYRLEALLETRNEKAHGYNKAEKEFDEHRERYETALLLFIANNKHRADAVALETEFGSIWFESTRNVTRRYDSAFEAYHVAHKDYERAQARKCNAELLAERLEPLQREPPRAEDLGGKYVSDRKRKRIENWMDLEEEKQYPPQKKLSWDARSFESGGDMAGGLIRRKIDELDEFCGRLPKRLHGDGKRSVQFPSRGEGVTSAHKTSMV
ncbi:hypothetical protein N0V83_000595 [Neocucurbitaria cava]|uniref:Uncharacterized protein n=1 Tax=Neocucurbitaria cava TaxID=798079 RepID=A0A9W9CR98_9PLEO|nr:hypothetical protein N0V83_000595 [Neocucurbitaria cava]